MNMIYVMKIYHKKTKMTDLTKRKKMAYVQSIGTCAPEISY